MSPHNDNASYLILVIGIESELIKFLWSQRRQSTNRDIGGADNKLNNGLNWSYLNHILL